MAFTINDATLEAMKVSAQSQWLEYFNRYTTDALESLVYQDSCSTEFYAPFHILPVVAGKEWEAGHRQKQTRASFASKKTFTKYEGSFMETEDQLEDDPGLVARLSNGGMARDIAESRAKTLKALNAKVLNDNAEDFTGQPLFATNHKYLTTDTFAQSNIIAAEAGDPKVPFWYVTTNDPIVVRVKRHEPKIEVVGQGDDNHFEYDVLKWGWTQRLLVAPLFWGNIVRSNKPIDEENVQEAITRLEGFKNMTGTEDLGNVATKIIVPKTLRAAAEKLLKVPFNAMGASNFMFGKLDVIVADSLSNTVV